MTFPPAIEENTMSLNTIGKFPDAAEVARPVWWRRNLFHAPVPLACATYVALRLWADPMDWIVTLLFMPVIVLWSIITFTLAVTRSAGRRTRLINLLLWGVTIIASAVYGDVTHDHGRSRARQQADAVLAQVQAHRARTGAWPADLMTAGVDTRTIVAQEIRFFRQDDGSAGLTYTDKFDGNFMGVSFYLYDFKRQVWEHVRD
jgi:hypothetical protein